MSAAPPVFLVTGGAGFIGSHLCDALLARGGHVRVVDDLSTGVRGNLDPRIEFIEGDIGNRALMVDAMSGVAGVFHLAAIASVARANEDWPGTHRVNLGAAVGLFDLARDAGPGARPVPVVYASSAAVYGDTEGAIASEDRPPAPLNAYGADKLGCEFHAAVASRIHGVPTAGLRFFNVYGRRQNPGSPYSGVISIFADRIPAQTRIALHGGGRQQRDFIHVSDVVAHLMAAFEVIRDGPARCLVANACTGRSTSIHALAALLAGLAGVALDAAEAPVRQGDIPFSCGSAVHARRTLGVAASVALEHGLRDLLPDPRAG